jgi:hypothetical protein
MSESKGPQVSRRVVFAGAGAAGALAGAAALLPGAPAVVAAVPGPKVVPLAGAGYQETPHVLSYYKTARV